MSSYNYRRILIEAVTTEDLQTEVSRDKMLQQLTVMHSMNSAVVRIIVVDRTDTLEQIVNASERPVSLSEFSSHFPCTKTPSCHKESVESACFQLGLDF